MSGPTTTKTTDQSQTGQQSQAGSQISTGQSTSTPNLPPWLAQFYQSQPGQSNQLVAKLGAMGSNPLYGPQQQAQFQQQLNQQYGQADQTLQSQLARSGALNSNRAASADTSLALGKAGQVGNYLSQTPLLNAQYQQSVLGQQGNALANAMNYRPPVIGQTTDTSQAMQSLMNALSSSQSNSTEVDKQSGGLLQSLLGGLLGAGMSALTGGLGGMLGGGGFGAGASQALGVQPSGGGGSSFTPYSQGNSFQMPQMPQSGFIGAPPPSNAYGGGGFGLGGYNPLDQFGQYRPQGM